MTISGIEMGFAAGADMGAMTSYRFVDVCRGDFIAPQPMRPS